MLELVAVAYQGLGLRSSFFGMRSMRRETMVQYEKAIFLLFLGRRLGRTRDNQSWTPLPAVTQQTAQTFLANRTNATLVLLHQPGSYPWKLVGDCYVSSVMHG